MESLEPRWVLAAPVAANDEYTTFNGAQLDVPAPGFLSNDSDADGDPFQPMLVDNVDHGSLTFNADGSFSYLPNAGFRGQDSFQYKLVSQPQAVSLNVVQAQSNVTVNATLRTPAGNDSSADSSSLTGTMAIRLAPPSQPFGTAQVTAANLVLADGADFRFEYLCTIFGCALTVTASAAPNAIAISMVTPGAPAAVDGAGNFAQLANTMHVAGQANVNCSGAFCGTVTIPPNPQVFDDDFVTDLNGRVSLSGSNLTLTLPLSFTGVFDIADGVTLDLNMTGQVVATGTVAASEQSNVATVTLHSLDPVTARPDTYHTREERAIAVFSPPVQADEVILPAGSQWRYLDNGSDQGTAWRGTAFNDSAWAIGPAELGYGESDQATVVSFGPDANNKYVTTYLRRKFTVHNAAEVSDLLINLKRDDGAVVYVNGVEVVRDGLPPNPAFNTPAANAADDGQTFLPTFTVPATMLVSGENLIAVEIHQATPNTSDMSFDLELKARRGPRSVLANDTNNLGGGLIATLIAGPQHGTLDFNPDGTFLYTPNPDFSGTDSFTYGASSSGPPITGPVTVTIVVTPVNDPPLAMSDGTYSVPAGQTLSVNAAAGVLANDSDPDAAAFTAVVATPPTQGNLTLNPDGSFTYQSATAGPDSFTYRAVQPVSFVPFGSTWRYLDDGTDQGTAWREVGHEDSNWAVGAGQLGYGDNDETTVVRYGSAAANKHITTYFRHAFEIDDPASVRSLSLRLIRDDGAVVYLNGVEVGRSNLPAGAITAATLAPVAIGGADESAPQSFTVDPTLLLSGINVIAVEMHQQAASSSDLSFDLELTGTLQSAAATVSIVNTSTTAPRVQQVFLRGSAWTSSFTSYLASNGLGSDGYAIPAGADQLAILPWSNTNRVTILFSEPVTNLPAGLSLVGSQSGAIATDEPLTAPGPGGTFLASWRLAGGAAFSANEVTLSLPDSITSSGGTPLDGDWVDGASAYPSGNGTAGGAFTFRFRTLPGDVERDGDVDLRDVIVDIQSGFVRSTQPGYSPYLDVTGDGIVNMLDQAQIRNYLGEVAPSPPAAASALATNETAVSNKVDPVAPLAARRVARPSVAQRAAIDRVHADSPGVPTLAGTSNLRTRARSLAGTRLEATIV